MLDEGKKTWISVSLFFAVFTGLLLVATFFDLEIDRILTSHSLAAGDFYTDDIYANFFEAVGMFPSYAIKAFIGIIVMWLFFRTTLPSALRYLLFAAGFVFALHAMAGFFRDLIEYPLAHIVAKYALFEQKELYYPLKPYFYAIEYFASFLTVTLAAVLSRKITYETWCKLAVFAVAAYIVLLLTGETVSALKSYVDRPRFRSMNSTLGESVGGFGLYTRWYEVTDNAKILRGTLLTEYKDAFRSFPSGHTSNAGASYTLIMLIPCLEIKDKRVRAALWTLPTLWTGLTAVGRMVAGAHFLSDVLLGGTFAFVYMILAREVFFFRGSHVKAMFGGKKDPLLEEKRF